jgi:anti-sigma-K factor RskA
MAHEDYKEMLALHVLTALDSQDESVLHQHLATCAECRAELDAWRATASALACAAQPIEPSAQARERILESVRAESEPSRSTPANVIHLAQASKRRSSPVLRFEAIAAALIFVALIIGLAILWKQNRAAKAELARLASQIEESRRALDQEHEALELVTSSGARMTELRGTKDAPGAHAMLFFDHKTGRAILMARGLPAAPAGKAYQLWFMVGTRPMPGKVFTTDSAGNAMSHDQVPAEALDSKVFAVTLEPQGGAASPTGTMYLLTTATNHSSS